MSITDRLSFITRSYLNAIRRRGKSVLDEAGLDSVDGSFSSDDELEREIRRKVEEELSRRTHQPRSAQESRSRAQSEGTKRANRTKRERTPRRRIVQCYANLELTPSATADEVHKAWRRLILKYHPDRYPGDTAKQERATRITQIVNESYHILLSHLGEDKNKGR